jgi:hypothetical protein
MNITSGHRSNAENLQFAYPRAVCFSHIRCQPWQHTLQPVAHKDVSRGSWTSVSRNSWTLGGFVACCWPVSMIQPFLVQANHTVTAFDSNYPTKRTQQRQYSPAQALPPSLPAILQISKQYLNRAALSAAAHTSLLQWNGCTDLQECSVK